MKTLRPLCLVALTFALQACSEDPGSGDVRVGVSTAALTADVTRVELTVSGAGISPDIVQTLTQDPGDQALWTGDVPNIPAGAGRVFTARAYDVADVLLYEGSAVHDISDGVHASVLIILNEQAPTGFSNVAPRFTSLVLDANPVQPGQLVQMTADASDPDQATGLTYDWSATGGSFATPQGSTVTWTAPTTAGDYIIAVSVTDSHGARSQLEFTMTVQVGPAGTGTASLSGEVNNAPVIINLTASDGQVDAGETVNLSLDVTDPEGDPMSFDWSADCDGTFSDATTQNPNFTLNTLPAGDPPADCTVSVEITDARGATNTASLSLATGPDVCEAGGCPKSAGGAGGGVGTAPTGLVYVLSTQDGLYGIQAMDMDTLDYVDHVFVDLDGDLVTREFQPKCHDLFGGIAWSGSDDGRVVWTDVLSGIAGVGVSGAPINLGTEPIDDIVIGPEYVWALHSVPYYDLDGVRLGVGPELVRINPATSQFTRFDAFATAVLYQWFMYPDRILVDGDRLWAIGSSKIAAYDSSSGAFIRAIDSNATGITATQTSVWVVSATELRELDRDLHPVGSPIDLSSYGSVESQMAATDEAIFIDRGGTEVLRYDITSGALELFDVYDPGRAESLDQQVARLATNGERLFFANRDGEIGELDTSSGALLGPTVWPVFAKPGELVVD